MSGDKDTTSDPDQPQPCAFFIEHGYCTLGTQCKLVHDRSKYDDHGEGKKKDKEEDDPNKLTEICFSFDTTGSMYTWLQAVRTSLREIIQELFEKIGNLRIALIAHGDYCDTEDWNDSYTLKYENFTRDINALLEFTKVKSTYGGGDGGECYEYVMWTANNTLSWTQNEPTNRVLVIIGDEPPHTPDFYQNRQNLDWRKEAAELHANDVVCYGINCGGDRIAFFYKGIAEATNGAYLQLSRNKGNLSKLIMGLCLQTSNNAKLLEEYRLRLMRSNQCDKELEKALNALGAMVDAQWSNDYDHVDDASVSKQQQQQGGNGAPRKVIPSAIKRLFADLNEVRREKLEHISVVPDSDNVFSWHCNVRLKEGLLKDEYVHFVLDFKQQYPSVPPKISLRATNFPKHAHENITDCEICLPLFGTVHYQRHHQINTSLSFPNGYGSGWSAAYSITSLLMNICSILSEIKKVDKSSVRNTRCSCGHSRTTPFPPLECNKLPIELVEYDYNDPRDDEDEAHVDAEDEKVAEKGDKQKKKKPSKDRARGVSIIGNVLGTQNRDQYWIVKSAQDIRRSADKCVVFEFELNWFDPKKKLTKPKNSFARNQPKPKFSDIVFGFVNANNAFFGVDMAGNLVFDNKVAKTGVFSDSDIKQLKAQDILTFVLKFRNHDAQKDELIVLCNYAKIAHISIPSHLFADAEDTFYPQLFLKNTRIYLHLTREKCRPLLTRMKVKSIKKSHLYFMDGLPQNLIVSANRFFATNEHYKDQTSWNWLFERAFSAEIVLEIATYLCYVELVRCKYVCTFWRSLFTNFNVIDRNEMYCFFTRDSVTTNARCVLGVGLNVEYSDNHWIRAITTDMDFLSLTAYIDYDVKKSVWGRPITHFLPLVINERHGKLAERCMIKRLAMICQAKQKFDAETTLSALTAVMNEFVVQLMHAGMEHLDDDEKGEQDAQQRRRQNRDRYTEAKHASEKALIGYCSMHHLLVHLALKFPKLVETAHRQLQRFIHEETYRHKSLYTHNLGKLLLNLSICLSVSWDDLKFAYIEEASIRNVKWAIEKYANLTYLDTYKCSDAYRIESMFKSTTVSRRLIKFQLWFLRNIARPPHVQSLQQLWADYNKRWGRPTPQQKQQLLALTKQLLQPETCFNHNAWLKHYQHIGLSDRFQSRHDVVRFLRENVDKSRQKSYHHSDFSVVAANRAYKLHMKFNIKKDAFHRRCVSQQRDITMHVLCNPSKYEGIRIEYDEDDKDGGDDGKDTDTNADDNWVNIYEAKTHRWYIGYRLSVQRDTQTCSVMYVGWNKHFVEQNVPLQSTMIAKFGSVALKLCDPNLKAGYIDKHDCPRDISAQQIIDEYEEKVALETQVQKERYEKIHFYHREFFKAVTDNNLEKVKKFLRPKHERTSKDVDAENDDDEDEDEDEDEGEDKDGSNNGDGNSDRNHDEKDASDSVEELRGEGVTRGFSLVPRKIEKPKTIPKGSSAKKQRKKSKKDNSQEWDKLFDVKSKQSKKKKNRKKKTSSDVSVDAAFYFEDPKAKKKTSKKAVDVPRVEEFVHRPDETERLYWHNFDIEINREMTDAFNRTPLFLSCYMGFKEMTKLLLAHSFDVNVVDINDENALNQILYSQKHKLQKDAESMVLADLISTAMQQQQTVRKQKQKIRVDDKSDDKCPHHYYVQISGLSDVRFEAEVIDLCAMYDIYPNELIFKRNSAVVGVNDADIMSKIYQMDESFFRCSLLSVSLLQGNAYDTNKLSSTLPTNTLYVTGFDLIEDVENKLLTIFSKYGKLRKKTLIVKTNKSEQNFTFVEYVYIKDAIHAYNDIHANKHQQRLKLNTNAKSNRKIFVRFAKTFNFGGKLGGAGFRPPSMLHNRGGVAKNGALRNGAKANDAQKANKEEDKKEQIYVEDNQDMYVHPLQQSVPRQLTAYEHVSYNSALCLIPPKEVWPGIQALRSKYDPDYLLYMPQITIFWPFMDETYFAEIASLIKREIIDKIKFEAFDVTLQNFDMSEGMKNHVYGNRTHKDMYVDNIFLQPDQKACNRMVYLYKHLANIWYDLGRSREYQPHLVVGKFQSRDLLYYKMQFNANYKPISWSCDALYLISRTPETQAQFSIKSRIPFYSGGAAK